MNSAAKFWAVVPAAGVGSRMDADRPKQYLKLNGKWVIQTTLERLIEANLFEGIMVAISKEDKFWPQLPIARHPKITVAPGGDERGDSVLSALNCLNQLAQADDWVLVHDAARCCITVGDIHCLVKTLRNDPVGGILALPVHDTIKSVSRERISQTLDRNRIWRALTPQMFRVKALRDALNQALQKNQAVTDEASAMELAGVEPKVVEGRADNIKITRNEDLSLAAFYLEQQCSE